MRARLGENQHRTRRRRAIHVSIAVILALSLYWWVSQCGLKRGPVHSLTSKVIEANRNERDTLAYLLKGESPVISIQQWLDNCPTDVSSKFHDSVIKPRVRDAGVHPPLPQKDFVCQASCAAYEPELEVSLKYLGGKITTYTANSLAKLCRNGAVPLLVRIIKGKAQWAKCVKNEKLKASHIWFAVQRTLLVLTRIVYLEDVVFAFDNSDFSRPAVEDTHGLSWNYVLPGVVRFVSDSAHPVLLWPTAPYIRATSYCQFDRDFLKGDDKWITEGGCERGKDIRWEDKSKLVFWRGSPTGVPIDEDHVQYMPRSMFNLQFSNKPGYDVAFIKEAIPPYASDDFLKAHLWLPGVAKDDFSKHKIVVSLDGHTAAWGLIERLASGSLLLVHESLRGYREFYYKLLEPYVHFVPIDFDFTNLEKIRLWALTPEGDKAAENIASKALQLVKTRMRPQDMWCYLFRMLATLAGKQNFRVMDPVFDEFEWRDITWESVRQYTKV